MLSILIEKTERSLRLVGVVRLRLGERYHKSSILNRQYSIPACPGWIKAPPLLREFIGFYSPSFSLFSAADAFPKIILGEQYLQSTYISCLLPSAWNKTRRPYYFLTTGLYKIESCLKCFRDLEWDTKRRLIIFWFAILIVYGQINRLSIKIKNRKVSWHLWIKMYI